MTTPIESIEIVRPRQLTLFTSDEMARTRCCVDQVLAGPISKFGHVADDMAHQFDGGKTPAEGGPRWEENI